MKNYRCQMTDGNWFCSAPTDPRATGVGTTHVNGKFK
jgi:hypothetical protein